VEFGEFVKCERNLRRSDERHQEYSELTEETLNSRAFLLPQAVEEAAMRNELTEAYHTALEELPEVQRRRFIWHLEEGLTYEQIAERERCSKVSVFRSVRRAEEYVKEKLKNFQNQG
jgi:RNA polymerase sigma-70 factor (ECF subfamily)